MLATVEGMEEEEEEGVILATMEGTTSEDGEVGRLLLFHNSDTGILDILKAMHICTFTRYTWSKSWQWKCVCSSGVYLSKIFIRKDRTSGRLDGRQKKEDRL